ncbi:DUF222 domain-containing protein [[Arthrobacter] sp. ATCC 21022]|uniref:HNH endonuclease signature motif containing protein n=1 Tax=[Arthrobacter] sp. ATCC 21022 TaxID=1771959 RepID=UPI002AA5B752
MGLSGQVVVERAGRPGAAAANGGGPPGVGDLPSKYPSGGGGVVEDVMEALEDGAAVLEAARALALPAGHVFDVQEAADFAARVEDLSRSIGYLQIIAAHAVERTRTEAKHNPAQTAPGWRTGWTQTPHPAHPHTPGTTARAGRPASVAGAGAVLGAVAGSGPVTSSVAGPGSVLDDGYRNAAEFLRARLRIDIREARRRLTQAALLLPGTTLTGETITPRHEHLATAFAATDVPSRSATIITTALERVAFIAHPDTLTTMEHALTRTATDNDPDFLAKTAQHWINRVDHDGPEPTEKELRPIQGAFIRKPRRGLHHIEIFATDEQYETLITTMNTATNPRLTPHNNPNTTSAGTTASPSTVSAVSAATSVSNANTVSTVSAVRVSGRSTPGPELDRRSRAQKLLDGLITGCNYALRTGRLPANGGLKPQLTVTIDANDLYPRLQNPPHQPTQPDQPTRPARPDKGGSSARPGSATATFTGPIHASTIRKIACDADILPVLLGTNGQILDIGRTTRIFPPHIRKAIAARDQGCTFPDCTIPAPWCEAHHITYWSQGGTTSTNNGTLLCSHHHHLIHKEQWKITTHQGIPWFTPPPHIDPTQTPQRNHHHTPHRT